MYGHPKLRQTQKKNKEPTKAYDSDKENKITHLKSEIADLKKRLEDQKAENDKLLKERDDEKKKMAALTVEREKTILDFTQNAKEPVDASLTFELKRLKEENNDLMIKKTSLESDVDALRTSLSKIAGSKLTESNPFISDLSDPHRPEKLTEKFSSLYDNDWTDAYEALLDKSGGEEEEICKCLINVFKGCWNFCFEMAGKQLLELRKTFLSLDKLVDNGQKPFEVEDNTPVQSSKLIKETRRLFAQTMIPLLSKHYWETSCKDLDESLIPFVDSCINLCWYSAVSDPPLYFSFEVDIHDNFRPFTKSGTTLDYIVWPSMYLYQNGPLMFKGVAQYKSDNPE